MLAQPDSYLPLVQYMHEIRERPGKQESTKNPMETASNSVAKKGKAIE